MSDEYRIQELLERDVYVGETRVGVITGERFHPQEASQRVRRSAHPKRKQESALGGRRYQPGPR